MSQITLLKYDWEQVRPMIDAHWLSLIERLQADEPVLRWCEVVLLTDEIGCFYDPTGGWNLKMMHHK